MSVCVFHVCLPVCFPNTVLHSCMSHTKDILGCLKSSMIHLNGMSGSPRNTYMAQHNMRSNFPPLGEKCFKNAWGDTDPSGPHGKCEHLPQPSPGCQEEEERHNQVATSSLHESMQFQPCPDTLLQVSGKRGSIRVRQHMLFTMSQGLC